MMLRCRTCGKNNPINEERPVFQCQNCGAALDPENAKLVETDPPKQSDPLADFR